jgi:hypothetical protein
LYSELGIANLTPKLATAAVVVINVFGRSAAVRANSISRDGFSNTAFDGAKLFPVFTAVIVKQDGILPNLLDGRLAEHRQRINRKLQIFFISTFFRFGLKSFTEKQDAQNVDDL